MVFWLLGELGTSGAAAGAAQGAAGATAGSTAAGAATAAATGAQAAAAPAAATAQGSALGDLVGKLTGGPSGPSPAAAAPTKPKPSPAPEQVKPPAVEVPSNLAPFGAPMPEQNPALSQGLFNAADQAIKEADGSLLALKDDQWFKLAMNIAGELEDHRNKREAMFNVQAAPQQSQSVNQLMARYMR